MRCWLVPLFFACNVEERLPVDVPEPGSATGTGPTWVDVAPILARCATCHDAGASTFPITGYDEAAALAPIIASVVSSREMPPWRASPDAAVDYLDDPSLTDAQIATVVDWAAAGAPLGSADLDDWLIGPVIPHLPRIDAVLSMAEPYVPQASPDDHRCFVIDRSSVGETWITGVEMLPGNRTAAHHLTLMAITPSDPENSPITADAADPLPGFACPDLSPTSIPGHYVQLGGWLPGRGATFYPEGTGVFLPEDALVVLKAHYFTPSAGGAPDLTRIHLLLEPEVAIPAEEMKINSLTWTRHAGIAVPAGKTRDHQLITDLQIEGLQMDIDTSRGVDVHWILLHMHTLGVSSRLEVRRNGENILLLDIPDWDFDWQLEYWLAEPFRIEPEDDIKLSCVHTNPTDEDVWWGELTSDEMCLARLFVSEPT